MLNKVTLQKASANTIEEEWQQTLNDKIWIICCHNSNRFWGFRVKEDKLKENGSKWLEYRNIICWKE